MEIRKELHREREREIGKRKLDSGENLPDPTKGWMGGSTGKRGFSQCGVPLLPPYRTCNPSGTPPDNRVFSGKFTGTS
jgi:hypothetical protein